VLQINDSVYINVNAKGHEPETKKQQCGKEVVSEFKHATKLLIATLVA